MLSVREAKTLPLWTGGWKRAVLQRALRYDVLSGLDARVSRMKL